MKIYKYSLIAACAAALTACDDINKLDPQGTGLTSDQLVESAEMDESRSEAEFAGLFTMMAKPYAVYGEEDGRDDDFGFVSAAISQDAEGADLIYPNSGYNWFSACGSYSSREPDYANPNMRYAMPYNQIKVANDIIKKFSGSEKPNDINHVAQARAIRAFDYLSLAPYYQFNYTTSADKPCVPLVTEKTTEFGNNPRATVKEVYKLILEDLNFAIDNLTEERMNKTRINKYVAMGLRARAYLNMGMWKEAADDAFAVIEGVKATEGLDVATRDMVSTPAFCNINETNWIWGYDMTVDLSNETYANVAAWLSSFSANSYSAGTQCYAMINHLLWNKISDTDIRKQWWVSPDLHSDLLSTIKWNGVSGDAISTLAIDDVKLEFLPYTNVKFGIPGGIGSTVNDADFPFMRVEEMYLIAAEGYAKSNNPIPASLMLMTVAKNRDPRYTIPSNRSFEDEVWFQRRVELWGEGFALGDLLRLDKPLVRFHEDDIQDELPADFRFNIPAHDGWLLMRFSKSETNTNKGIINNSDGFSPVQDQNPELRDGVTD